MKMLSLLCGIWKPSAVKQVTALALTIAAVLSFGFHMQRRVSASSVHDGPRIWLQEPHGVSSSHQGRADLVQLLASGQAEPLAMATGDFDEDGVADLAVGYNAAGKSILVIHRGNLDAFAPHSQESWQAISTGNFPPTFLSTATVSSLRGRPDFLITGKVTGSNHSDLISASRGRNQLDVFAGDGHGNFSSAKTITLPGKVTAMTAGDFGIHGPFSQLLIGVDGPKQASVLLYSGSEDGLSLQASFALPSASTAIALGDLDGDALPDAAILAGGQAFVLHALGTGGNPVLEPLNLPVEAASMALGKFVFDRDPRLQIAVLAPDGTVHIAAHSGLDSRFWTAEELKAMQQNRTKTRTAAQASLAEGWTVAESTAGVAPFTDQAHPPMLLPLRISGYGQDDVVILNKDAGQMAMVSHPNSKAGDLKFRPAESTARPYTAGIPVAVAAMRVNADGRKGMVTVHRGQVAPSVMEPLPDPTFVVNTTADTVDVNPGDGRCADAQGNCSLRAAVMEANAEPGVDTIVVPAGTFTLSIPGIDEDSAATGDLDITDGVNIVGAGSNLTIIQAGTNATNGIDKVFSVNPNGQSASFDTLLSNMTIQFGRNTSDISPFGGAFDWDAGTNGTGNITITSCNINSNSILSNTAVFSDGGGALFSNIVGGTTGTVTISNSTIQNNTAQDGGGGIWVGSTVPTVISNTQILNNQAVGGGGQTGGGILVFGPTGASQSAIHASTISGNQAGVQGGGIYTTEGLLIDQGSVISGNHSGGDGGGVWSNLTVDTTTIKNSTITSNSAVGSGGGIQVDSNTFGNNLSMNFSRIAGNTASIGSGLNNASGMAANVNLADNWWGCNTGPGAAPCDLVTGGATTSPWIAMTHTANPNSIATGASTTLTASFLQDSNGGAIAASNLGALTGVPVTFGNAVNGTISNPQSTIQSSGTATATFTATAGPAAHADATVDHATVTANVTVGGFTITISPATQIVLAGTSTSYTVTVTPVGSFSGTVTLSTSGCPANTTCSLSTTSIPNASGTATLSVSTTPSTAAANSQLNVTGTSGTSVSNTNATLSVQDFAMVVTPATQSVNVGSSVAYTITVNRLNGFAGTVTPSVSGLPTGASATFNPTTIGGRVTSSTMTVSTTSATPTANSIPTVSGSSGGQSRNTTFTLSVNDFTISVTPASRTINAGASTTYTVTVTPVNGFTGNVTPSVSGLPSGATGTFSPTPISITTGAATSTLTVLTSSTTPAATSTLSIAGAAASGLSHSTTATLAIQDFSISPPSLPCIVASSSVTSSVTLTGLNGFTGPATLTLSGLPAGASGSLTPNPVTITGTVTATLNISTSAATPGGNYTLTISATANGVTHAVTLILCVQNFALSVSPTTQSLNAGTTVTYTITVTPQNGFTGVVTLSQTGLPTSSGASASFSPSSLTFTNTSGALTSSLTVATTSGLAGNSYPFTVSGINGNLVQTASATLNVKNFTLTISPASQSIVAGTSTSFVVTATPVNGYTGTLNCGVSGLTAGETVASCPQLIITGPNAVSGTLSINTTASVGPTNVVFTVTYTDSTGAPVHSVTANLITQDFSIIINPPSQAAPLGTPATYTVSVSPINGFTGTINITCSIAPTGPTFSVPCPASLTITNASPVSASFTVTTTQATASAQNYTITANGKSAAVPALTHSTAATLQAEDFGLSIAPGGQTVVIGNSVTYTVTATSLNGFSGVVALNCSGTMAGANVSCNPVAVNVPSGGSASATLTVATTGSTVAGNFTVSVVAGSGSISHSASAGISITDSRALTIIGSVNSNLGSSCCYPFSVTINGFTESVNYCECVLGGQFMDNPTALASALATAFNNAAGSPVMASASGGQLTLTAKSTAVPLNISSVDGGSQGGGIGGLSFMMLPVASGKGTVNFTIIGSIGSTGASPAPFSVTVNGFTETVNYCECVLGGKLIDNPGALATALASAFNGATGSPVTATATTDATGNAVLTLNSKAAGAALTASGSDGGATLGGMGGFSFLAIPGGSTQSTANLTIFGSLGPNLNGSFSVSANGFVETVTYCECVVGGRLMDNPSALATTLDSAFNSAPGSPVNATSGTDGSGNAVLTLANKTTGAAVTVSGFDGGNVGGGVGGLSFIGRAQQP